MATYMLSIPEMLFLESSRSERTNWSGEGEFKKKLSTNKQIVK
jgi:hypothetical protein